jgi:predicted Zn finger-like uncharacterized protein
MDVVCGRCRAEYEFDDALISERGTTVRCTNCGLQFKVFPPVGLRAPEVWHVFHPRDRRVEPIRYDSLRQMQKDIARGVVTAEHLLARGDESPRPLRDIVELQPLLQQPRSEPPPPADTVAAAPARAESEIAQSAPAQAAPGMKTVLGVAQRPDPKAHVGAPAPPRPLDDLAGDLDLHAIVPAEPSDPKIPVAREKPRDAKPRIRSALSVTPPTIPSPKSSAAASDTELDEGEGRASIPPPRQSLRSTLSGTSAAQRISPVPEELSPPSSKGRAAPGAEGEGAASSAEAAPLSPRGERKSEAGITAEEPPALRREGVVPPLPEEAKAQARPAPPQRAPSRPVPLPVTLPVEPTISDSGEYPGLMTPTPTGMRAYRSAEADPASSVAGVHVKQRARTGGIVLVVLVGGMAFLGFANRDKLSAALSGGKPEVSEEQEAPQEIPPDLTLRLQMADAAWISATLLQTPKSALVAPSKADLEKLEAELSSLGASRSWERVNLLRALGRLTEARESAGALQKEPEQLYALALLDLAEAKDAPPWPIVIERLREASSGERGRFLARSAFIYALGASGALPRARADFEALGQLAGGKEAPLYSELRDFLERIGAFEKQDENGPSAEIPAESGDLSVVDLDEGADAAASPQAEENAPAAPEEEGERPLKPKVSAAIKGKVDQADAMWRGGNQEGALVIYRQVVAEIGTKHFLGQRSAARIAQAERERASDK